MIEIFPIPALKDNYIWCITDTPKQSCVIIDPGEADPVIKTLHEYQLDLGGILVTHHHYDHTQGIAQLLLQSPVPVPVYGPVNEKIPFCSQPVSENNKINVEPLEFEFKVLDIPGHTKGHIAFIFHNAVFCGDTLFTAGCGKIFEGTVEQMYQSISKLAALPNKTLIYCGHEYTESNLKFAQTIEPFNKDIGERIKNTEQLRKMNLPTVPAALELEKKTNPFLRCDQPAVISAAGNYAGRALVSPIDVFTVLREWKNNW